MNCQPLQLYFHHVTILYSFSFVPNFSIACRQTLVCWIWGWDYLRPCTDSDRFNLSKIPLNMKNLSNSWSTCGLGLGHCWISNWASKAGGEIIDGWSNNGEHTCGSADCKQNLGLVTLALFMLHYTSPL